MSDLITRLQSLTAPSREIDAEIALANGWTKHEADEDYDFWKRQGAALGEFETGPPLYTKSLDAALTLLPDGCQWEVGSGDEGFRADIFIDTGADIAVLESFGAATPAIALLIAIMKARAGKDQSEATE